MDPNKCRHERCTCTTQEPTGYCSTACAESTSGNDCLCGHLACSNSTSNASAEGRGASTITLDT